MSAIGPVALRVELVVHESVELALPDRLPDGGRRTWAPITSTLLIGGDEVVLVDPPLTTTQASAVLRRIRALDRRLSRIVVTHAHGDHWFTAASIAGHLDDVEVTADPGVIQAMHGANQTRKSFWDRILPGQIPDSPVTAQPAPDNRFELEGREVRIVPLGHTDTDETTVVHVPDIDFVAAGDVVYDDAHLFLVESGHGGRQAWQAALDQLAALRPRYLSAGHASRAVGDAAALIADTRRYLADVEELLPRHGSPSEFFAAMIQRHPTRANRSTLWGSSAALYATTRTEQPSASGSR